MKKFIRANNRPVKASESDVDGYAVKVHDMGKGYIHLFVYDTEEEADDAYNRLNSIRVDADYGDIDDYEYEALINIEIDSAKDIISEIDWRRNIDKNNVYSYDDDDAIQIVNDVAIPMYLYW